MNKNTFKKTFVAFIAAMTMVAATVPAYADDPATTATGSISINATTGETSVDHTYVAYQVFKGTISGGVLTNIEWGDGVDGTALLTALKSDLTVGTSFDGCTTAADVAEKLATFSDNSADAKAFAKVAKANVKADGKISEDTATNDKFSNLEDGYYLVYEESAPTSSAQTAYILKVVGGPVTVNPKTSVPTFDKYILEGTEKKQYVSDYNIGDDITFVLEATVSDISEYSSYTLKFTDEYDAGLTFNNDIKVYVGETELVNSDSETKYTVDTTTANKFTVTIEDIKTAYPSIATGDIVKVVYTAKLNSNAIIGKDGNENKATLDFSNNPNGEGEGTTPEDKVVVFTFGLSVDKVDGADTTTKLSGAEFKLANADGKYAKVTDGILTGWADTEADGSVLTSDSTGNFKINGLDVGTYKLYETKAPTGYNKLTTPVDVTISVTYDETNYTYTAIAGVDVANINAGIVSATVENNSGTSLPTTGGIGTTIFFVSGGVIVVAAAVTLIIKKRINNVD